jgi:peroxin-5
MSSSKQSTEHGLTKVTTQMMDEFMQQPAHLAPTFQDSPFAMEQMRRELDHASSPAPAAHWAAEFEPQMASQPGPGYSHQEQRNFSPQDFARFQQNRASSPLTNVQQTPMSRYQSPMQYGGGMFGSGMGMSMGMGGMSMGMGGMGQQHQQQQQSKGKERMVELDDRDWEAQFDQLDAPQEHQQQDDTLDAEANAAIEAELQALDRSVEASETLFGDFESVWEGIQAETTQNRDFAARDADRFDQWDGFDGLNTQRDPSLGDYMFEDDNPFAELANPFDEGVKIMREGGNLSLAALAFEAAVQKDPEHMAAWTALGQAQAQNEKESPAIRALEHALKLDPNNLEALMGLAVSYTNEGYDSTAYRTLERWVATKYPSLVTLPLSNLDDEIGFTDRHALHEKVTDLFIQAAQLSPHGEQMDPDVQVGLGVLFYGAEEYDKAVDCFGAALESTEQGSTNRQEELHLLWNRLGATLANSGRSEEAIDAYSRALDMRPNFVRARYNLGVSCINIGCFEEAAQHLLGALAMHRITEQEGLEKARQVVGDKNMSDAKLEAMITQNQSTNLYDTLRRVFAQMDRRDLQEAVGPGMNLDDMRKQFEF